MCMYVRGSHSGQIFGDWQKLSAKQHQSRLKTTSSIRFLLRVWCWRKLALIRFVLLGERGAFMINNANQSHSASFYPAAAPDEKKREIELDISFVYI